MTILSRIAAIFRRRDHSVIPILEAMRDLWDDDEGRHALHEAIQRLRQHEARQRKGGEE